MRIVGRDEIGKLVTLLERIRKEQVTPFKQSRLYPQYMYWNRGESEHSKMYPTVYATPTLLAEAEKLIPETTL